MSDLRFHYVHGVEYLQGVETELNGEYWWYRLMWRTGLSCWFGPYTSREFAVVGSGYAPSMERTIASSEEGEQLTLHMVSSAGVQTRSLSTEYNWQRIVRCGLPGCSETYELQNFDRTGRDENGDPMSWSEPLRGVDCLEFPDGSMLRLDELTPLP